MKKWIYSGMLIAALVSLGLLLTGRLSSRERSVEKDAEHPNDWFYRQRAYPYMSLRSDQYYQAMEQVREMEAKGLKSGGETWQIVGPVNIGGRVTDAEMPINDTKTIYIGAASGGIFKSTDLGTRWTPVFDQSVALSIGDLDISQTDPDLIWVGTGEPNAGGGSHTYEGNGVYKSENAGATWIHCGLNGVGNIGRVKIHPLHPDTVYVAAMGHLFADNAERGVFRTYDGGANWQKVLYLTDSTGSSDLCINPSDPDMVYAAMWERTRRPPYQSYGGKTSGLWRSADGGDNWTELLNGLPKGNVGRIGLGISHSNPNVLYATYTDSTGYLLGIFKTTDGGDNWTQTADLGENSSYWWWFSEVDVDPINPNIAYVSGFNAYKTTNGGTSWSRTFGNAHVDQHGVFIHPHDNSLAILCNDGGVYISRTGGATDFHIESLPITQFYTCEVDYQNPDRHFGGTQDNGTIRGSADGINRWTSIYGGDGFVVKVDPSDDNYVYAQSQYGGLGRSIDGGNTFMSGTSGISGNDRKNWKSPLELDPSNPSTLYFGANRMYKSTNRAQSWRSISGDLTNGPGVNVTYGTITTISVSPLNSRIIYAGTDDGNVWNTLDGGDTWNQVSATLPVRWITCVETSPSDTAEAFVTISGYRWDSYLPHVYRTRDNGLTWNDISGNLPDFPVNSIVIDPDNTDTYYIGTDGGVFLTMDGGSSWEIYGDGLPGAPVFDLYLHNPTRMLSAATFGRSMYTIPLAAGSGTGDIVASRTDIRAWPNPFLSELNLSFNLNHTSQGELSVFDLNGRQIKLIHRGNFPAGENRFTWNGTDGTNSKAAAGIYLVRLVTGHDIQTVRLEKI
jgi:photosystem II stability/assembly factor-like uncharacterized protein